MNSSESLYNLIKSLSKREKRVLKASTKGATGNSKYYKLYQLFDKQKVFNEDRLLKKIKDPFVKKNFSRVKHYLYHQLLDVISKSANSVSTNFFDTIKKVEVLNAKGLYYDAMKLLDSFSNDAFFESENFILISILIEWRIRLSTNVRTLTGNFYNSEFLYEELLKYTQKQLNKVEYQKDKNTIGKIYNEEKRSTSIERQTILNNGRYYSSSNALSFTAKATYYLNKLALIFNQGGVPTNEINSFMEENYTFLEENQSKLIKILGFSLYSFSIGTFINAYVSLDNVLFEEKVKKLINPLVKAKNLGHLSQINLFLIILKLKCWQFNRSKDLQNKVLYAKEIEKEILSRKINKYPLAFRTATIELFNLYVEIEYFKEARVLIYKLLKFKDSMIEDELIQVKILELLVLIEMDENDLFKSRYQSFLKIVNKNNYILNSAQRFLVNSFKEIKSANKSKGKQVVFKKLSKLIDYNLLPKKDSFFYFDYKKWINTKLKLVD